MNFEHDEQPTNPTASRPLSAILDAEVSRRGALKGGALGAAGFIAANAFAPAASAQGSGIVGNFTAIPTNANDDVTVPGGYVAQAIVPWGDPIVPSGPTFVPDASNTAAEQAEQLGQGHDGIKYFPIAGSSTRGLLAINHEYTIGGQIHTDGQENWSEEKTRKEQAAHGVSVVEIEMDAAGNWSTVESSYARRIHANTPTTMTGPAVGHRLLQTDADPDGTTPLGTWNNCGNGYTPWDTYLTTEENFNGYFWEESEGGAEGISEEQATINARYGVAGQGFGYQWATTDERFRADLHANEPNRFGWMVEIDPFDPTSPPVKHTAMGRFKHEGAAFATAANGAAVVYMGDDQRFDDLYKFVGANAWEADLAAGNSPLAEGTLHVARFDEGSVGEWLPLLHGENGLDASNGFADQGDVMIKARLAVDVLGATPMDRPEWTAVHPRTGEAYVACTNNTRREEPNVANPRVENAFGHIVKWTEDGGDPANTTFTWDFFLLAGAGDGSDGSTIEAEDLFGSPDGLWVDENERMWIQTDGSQPDGSNNQMLLADPNTGEIKRFLVGPVDCEVTGVTTTPDGTTMFINIQHPGDSGGPDNPTETSTWPDGPGAGRPRPATVAIRRRDGGVVGANFADEVLASTGTELTGPLAIAGATAVAAGAGLVRFRNRLNRLED
ncbi:MAG: PhoX family phosphatase [Actinomycetota bacterium]